MYFRNKLYFIYLIYNYLNSETQGYSHLALGLFGGEGVNDKTIEAEEEELVGFNLNNLLP